MGYSAPSVKYECYGWAVVPKLSHATLFTQVVPLPISDEDVIVVFSFLSPCPPGESLANKVSSSRNCFKYATSPPSKYEPKIESRANQDSGLAVSHLYMTNGGKCCIVLPYKDFSLLMLDHVFNCVAARPPHKGTLSI